MSTTYFIGPLNPDLPVDNADRAQPSPEFLIGPDEYAQKIRARWPFSSQASIKDRLLWWLDEQYVHGIEVMLHGDHQHVSISGSGANFGEFVLWHRSLIASMHYTVNGKVSANDGATRLDLAAARYAQGLFELDIDYLKLPMLLSLDYHQENAGQFLRGTWAINTDANDEPLGGALNLRRYSLAQFQAFSVANPWWSAVR